MKATQPTLFNCGKAIDPHPSFPPPPSIPQLHLSDLSLDKSLLQSNFSDKVSIKDVVDYLTGVNDPQIDPIKFVPGRKRREDPLPYDMSPKGKKSCRLCGPPFDDHLLEGLLLEPVCSFECGKRYFVEAVAKPAGFTLKHAKVKLRPQFDRETGITLSLCWLMCISSPLSYVGSALRTWSQTRKQEERWSCSGGTARPHVQASRMYVESEHELAERLCNSIRI